VISVYEDFSFSRNMTLGYLYLDTLSSVEIYPESLYFGMYFFKATVLLDSQHTGTYPLFKTLFKYQYFVTTSVKINYYYFKLYFQSNFDAPYSVDKVLESQVLLLFQ